MDKMIGIPFLFQNDRVLALMENIDEVSRNRLRRTDAKVAVFYFEQFVIQCTPQQVNCNLPACISAFLIQIIPHAENSRSQSRVGTLYSG